MSLAEPGTSSTAAAWDRHAVAYQNTAKLSTNVVGYGPGMGTELEYRLLGPVSGKRVIDLGCGGGQATIALAKQGATAIGVDISVEQLAYARRLIEQEEVRVELKHGDLAELAFQRADSIDIVFSAFAFQYVPDLNRVFRQAHRVLKPQGMLVFSVPHPTSALTETPPAVLQHPGQLSLEPDHVTVDITRSYFDRSPIDSDVEGATVTSYQRTVSDIFMGLVRSGYRVDVVLEPEIAPGETIPQALIVRARKES